MKRMFYLMVMASMFSVNAAKTTKATSKPAAKKAEPKKKFTIKSEFDDSKAQEKAKLQGIEKVSKNADCHNQG